jgi:hypothetical protein
MESTPLQMGGTTTTVLLAGRRHGFTSCTARHRSATQASVTANTMNGASLASLAPQKHWAEQRTARIMARCE